MTPRSGPPSRKPASASGSTSAPARSAASTGRPAPPSKAKSPAISDGDAPISQFWLAERRRETVLKLIGSLEVLPTTMAVPYRVMQLRQKPGAGAREFAEVLSTDPSLSARILSLVNSAWFSPVRPVTRISDAVAMIGMGNLLPLVFAGSLAAVYNTMAVPTEQLDVFWRSALLKAVAAREYAKCRQPEKAEEAFLAGLLQDMGLALMYAGDPAVWQELATALDLGEGERLVREHALFAIDHAAVGSLLAQKLQVPDLYVLAAKHHHDLRDPNDGTGQSVFTDCVRFAAAIPHQIENWKRCGLARLMPFLQCVPKDANKPAGAVSLLDSIQREYDWLLAAVGNGATSSVTFREFIQGTTRDIVRCLELAVGEATMLASTFEERESKLKSQIHTLARESDQDSLTELLNRRGFRHALQRQLAAAAEAKAEVGIGFIDLDSFKAINDSCGHDVGDTALKAAAHAMRQALGGNGIAARLGGDEFAFSIAGVEPERAQRLAQEILDSLRRVTFATDSKTVLTMSGSIGLLWVGVPRPEQSLDMLLREADQLMYQAKRGGKARCMMQRLDAAGTVMSPVRQTG